MVVIAKRQHLYPFRTQQLSSFASMVLLGQPCGRVDNRHLLSSIFFIENFFQRGFIGLHRFFTTLVIILTSSID